MLKQIAFEDPPLLRKINRQIPAELETIIEKSVRKNPEERYATARDLAEDLRNFLANKPIKAKPPTWRQQLIKWSQRHPAAVRSTIFVTLAMAIVLGGSIGWITRDRAARLAVVNQQITQALKETEALHQAGKLSDAISAVKRAEGLLASGASDELKQRVDRWKDDLETVQRLEQIRFDEAAPPITLKEEKQRQKPNAGSKEDDSEQDDEYASRVYDREGARQKYQTEFRRYGLDLESLDVEKAARQIRESPIKQELVAALDGWFQVSRDSHSDKATSAETELLEVARLADPDKWRLRLRDAIQRNDTSTLTSLAEQKEIVEQPPPTVLMLARALVRENRSDKAAEVLQQAQTKHPADFWLNADLAECIFQIKGASDEVLGYQRAALAVRPDTPGAYNRLGIILYGQSKYADAEIAFREAARLKPDYGLFYDNLGAALSQQEKYAEAEAAYREAIRLDPENPTAHIRMGEFLNKRKRFAEAEAAFREAVRLRPADDQVVAALTRFLNSQGRPQEAWEADEVFRQTSKSKPDDLANKPKAGDAAAYIKYGPDLLVAKGRDQEAETALREAIRLDANNVDSYNLLGIALLRQDKAPEAEDAFRKAIDLAPNAALLHGNLGSSLVEQGKLAEAEAAYRKVVELEPKSLEAHQRLIGLLNKQGKFEDAEKQSRKVVRLEPSNPSTHALLGSAIAEQAKSDEGSARWDEAAAEFVQAIDLSNNGPSWGAPRKNVCRELAKWDEVFERVAKLRPDETDVWTGRAQDRELRNRWKEALQCFQKLKAPCPFRRKRTTMPVCCSSWATSKAMTNSVVN